MIRKYPVNGQTPNPSRSPLPRQVTFVTGGPALGGGPGTESVHNGLSMSEANAIPLSPDGCGRVELGIILRLLRFRAICFIVSAKIFTRGSCEAKLPKRKADFQPLGKAFLHGFVTHCVAEVDIVEKVTLSQQTMISFSQASH